MSIRQELILKVLAKEESISELAKEAGVSRKTVYKWLARYEEQGLTGLVDKSRRPKTTPTKTSGDMTLEIAQLKKEHMRWGPKKIAAVLARRHFERDEIPSLTTIARVLRQLGLMQRTTRRSFGGWPTAIPDAVAKEPNDVWTVDFKGWWKTGDGARCEPLTVRDAASRYVLILRLMRRTRYEDVRPVFEELFNRYGLPGIIQSDNGSPFASTRAPGGLTSLSAWWVEQGIRVVRSRPGHPQDNGAHERMHVDMRFDLEDKASRTLHEQQRACDEWAAMFNHQRPHEALGQRMPGELYRASSRRPASHVVGGFPDGCRIVSVSNQGNISIDGWKVHVSAAMKSRRVGVQRVEGRYIVWFYHALLGAFVGGKEETLSPV